jgi:hypothetical protein
MSGVRAASNSAYSGYRIKESVKAICNARINGVMVKSNMVDKMVTTQLLNPAKLAIFGI